MDLLQFLTPQTILQLGLPTVLVFIMFWAYKNLQTDLKISQENRIADLKDLVVKYSTLAEQISKFLSGGNQNEK